jgi:hypothetical protein
LAVVSTIALIDDVYDIQVHPNGIASVRRSATSKSSSLPSAPPKDKD